MYIYNMEFEWDEEKSESNLSKHGISFDEAKHIFSGPVLTFVDDRSDEYGEVRELSIGALGETIVLTVVHTNREGKVRLISARRANRQERSRYYDYIKETFR